MKRKVAALDIIHCFLSGMKSMSGPHTSNIKANLSVHWSNNQHFKDILMDAISTDDQLKKDIS